MLASDVYITGVARTLEEFMALIRQFLDGAHSE